MKKRFSGFWPKSNDAADFVSGLMSSDELLSSNLSHLLDRDFNKNLNETLSSTSTPISGLQIVTVNASRDERGTFGEIWNADLFSTHPASLTLPTFIRTAISQNPKKLTLRGMHLQTPPHQDARLVRVNRGKIYDVVVDLRPHSATFRKWHATELSAQDSKMLMIAEGLAHGYLTLDDDTEVMYFFSQPFVAASSAGVRWNDPAFNIEWPHMAAVISERDAAYPDFDKM